MWLRLAVTLMVMHVFAWMRHMSPSSSKIWHIVHNQTDHSKLVTLVKNPHGQIMKVYICYTLSSPCLPKSCSYADSWWIDNDWLSSLAKSPIPGNLMDWSKRRLHNPLALLHHFAVLDVLILHDGWMVSAYQCSSIFEVTHLKPQSMADSSSKLSVLNQCQVWKREYDQQLRFLLCWQDTELLGSLWIMFSSISMIRKIHNMMYSGLIHEVGQWHQIWSNVERSIEVPVCYEHCIGWLERNLRIMEGVYQTRCFLEEH